MSQTQTEPPRTQPDITYHPDFSKYQARRAKIKVQNEHIKTIPDGFPQQLCGPLIWGGKDFIDEKQWIFTLTPEHLLEIAGALMYFQGLNLPLGAISPTTFPLPTLSPQLRELSHTLHSGRGFFVIRGLKPDDHGMRSNIIIYAGLSSHIGSTRGRQDTKIIDGKRQSNMLNHIKDLTRTAVASNIGAPAYTTDKQVFHTDAGDIVGLFCLETAKEGGQSKVASSWRVYNEIAATRPDIIRTLTENWDFDGYGNPEMPYTTRPLLHHTPATSKNPERVVIQYARRGFVGFLHLPRSTSIPPITEAQAEALDTLHFLAEKHCTQLDFRKGDLQFINNLAVFHARDAFTDGEGQERYLLRLWLRDEELAWETPGVLRERWDELYKDVSVDEQVFSLEPRIRGGAGNKEAEVVRK